MLTTINTRWEATLRVMAAKLTRLTYKIAIQLHLVAETVLTPGDQSGNFWINPAIVVGLLCSNMRTSNVGKGAHSENQVPDPRGSQKESFEMRTK
jgi:hypothetical protein